jgi:hypothetical protein
MNTRSITLCCSILLLGVGWTQPAVAMLQISAHSDPLAEIVLHPYQGPLIAKETLRVWARLPKVKGFNQVPSEIIQFLPWMAFEEFDRSFVRIPAGYLKDGAISVESFEAAQTPVTRELWNEIMPDLRVSLDHCRSCPVTDVAWENEDGSPAEVQTFLKRLNERTHLYSCTYELPTDHQLWYMIRADQSGKRLAHFSLVLDSESGDRIELTEQNAHDYIIHEGNSQGRVQPVGLKKPNAFGIELGNVWKMSRDPFSPDSRQLGRAARGGSWFFDLSCAESDYRTIIYPGDRQDFVGFSLVRNCR